MPTSIHQLIDQIDALMQSETDDTVRAKLARIRSRIVIEFRT